MIRAALAVAVLGTGCAQLIGFEPEGDLRLVSLEVSRGTLVPAFDPEVVNYAVALPYVSGDLAVKATADADVTLSVAGATAASDTPQALALPVGDTTIEITLRTTSGVERTYAVSVHRADLDLAFSPPRSVFGFGSMYDVQRADLDGDTVDDLLYASFDGTVGTLINDGAGVFTTAAWLPPMSPRAMTVADVTSDGIADLLVTNGALMIAHGKGDGTFETAAEYGPFEEAGALAVGRVDDDAVDDLVIANGAGLVTPLFSRPAGLERGAAWTLAPYAGEPRIVHVAQMSGRRLVALDSSARAVLITTMTAPLVSTPFQLDAQSITNEMVVADLDADGTDDVVVLDMVAGTLTILTTFPDWTRTTVTVAGFPRSLVTGDLDDDGHVDLAMTAGNDLVILRNDGAAAFEERRFPNMANTPSRLAIGDFDHDGRDDVIFAQGTSELTMAFGVHRE